MKKIILLSLLVFGISINCSNSSDSNDSFSRSNKITGSEADESPEWVENLIETFINEPVGNPPQSIWRYTYKGKTVYYIPAQCCDQYSTLYSEDGKVICAPDGGFAGSGDGTCTDFFELRSDEELIWKDERE